MSIRIEVTPVCLLGHCLLIWYAKKDIQSEALRVKHSVFSTWLGCRYCSNTFLKCSKEI